MILICVILLCRCLLSVDKHKYQVASWTPCPAKFTIDNQTTIEPEQTITHYNLHILKHYLYSHRSKRPAPHQVTATMPHPDLSTHPGAWGFWFFWGFALSSWGFAWFCKSPTSSPSHAVSLAAAQLAASRTSGGGLLSGQLLRVHGLNGFGFMMVNDDNWLVNNS